MDPSLQPSADRKNAQPLYADFGPNNGSIVLNLSEESRGFQEQLHFTRQEIQGSGVTWLKKTKKVGGLRFINLSGQLPAPKKATPVDSRSSTS
jgi:hypothetical protein